MASLFRVGIGRASKSLLSPSAELQIIRCISSKLIRSIETDRPARPKPWDYENKKFTFLQHLYDRTSARFDENSKVIFVEGPVAAGKSKFAKELAEELDMRYYPEANQDMLYINNYGYDLRQLDEQLPESCRSFDINNFLVHPKNPKATLLQFNQYYVKYSLYVDALAHVFSTGQGVVMDRSPYSDFVFAEAMYKCGFLSKAGYKYYYDTRDNSMLHLLRPHLVIYLDLPVNKVLENIKKRAIPCEVNSPVLTTKYLTTMERSYKQDYLKLINKHAELLIYDWSDEGEVEVVVEDIERIDFDSYDSRDTKMKDWVFDHEEDWAMARYKFASNKGFLMAHFNVPPYSVPELMIDAEEFDEYEKIRDSAPGEKYDYGYNADMGDTGILFKDKAHRDTLALRERKLS